MTAPLVEFLPVAWLVRFAGYLVLSYVVVGLMKWRQSQTLQRADAEASKPQPAAAGKPQQNGTDGSVSHSANTSSTDQVTELIRRRRSIFPKDYNGQRVDKSQVEALLEAANWAPCHGKTEPWRWVVLATPEAQQRAFELALEISEELLGEGEELDKRRAKLRSWIDTKVPLLSHMIMIGCRRAPNAQGKMMPEWEDQAAVACALQNMALMTTSLGLAGYWSSWPSEDVRNHEKFKGSLGWDPEVIPMGVFFLGRSDRIAGYRAKRGPVAEKTTWVE